MPGLACKWGGAETRRSALDDFTDWHSSGPRTRTPTEFIIYARGRYLTGDSDWGAAATAITTPARGGAGRRRAARGRRFDGGLRTSKRIRRLEGKLVRGRFDSRRRRG